eukprot:TRINITY_DN420_c0_g1_i4.p1 TRINITY_DN420_c0_g1~~TRINITY_DN420_c0_g1_i4.p1  ORF type:complete len:110 (+),score=11.96 TRINITY_DN420_c0_g1_i4:111-440(+)
MGNTDYSNNSSAPVEGNPMPSGDTNEPTRQVNIDSSKAITFVNATVTKLVQLLFVLRKEILKSTLCKGYLAEAFISNPTNRKKLMGKLVKVIKNMYTCLLYTSPSPRDS